MHILLRYVFKSTKDKSIEIMNLFKLNEHLLSFFLLSFVFMVWTFMRVLFYFRLQRCFVIHDKVSSRKIISRFEYSNFILRNVIFNWIDANKSPFVIILSMLHELYLDKSLSWNIIMLANFEETPILSSNISKLL